MTCHFIPRQIHEPGGFGFLLREAKGLPAVELKRDVAGWRSTGRYGEGPLEEVTWKQLHAERTERLRERLERIRYTPPHYPRPAFLWVFRNDFWLYSGWYAYVTTTVGDFPIKGKGREGRSDARLHLMATVPVGLLPGIEDFNLWMEAFAATHPKPKTKEDPRVAGRLLGWTDGESWYASREKAEKGMEGRAHA